MSRQTFASALALLLIAVFLMPGQMQDNPAARPAADTHPNYMYSPRLGITHISLAEEPTSAERYAKALELGAGWNRWPLYWDRVEPEPGAWDWDDYDRLVQDDLVNGLQINAILLGRPKFAQASNGSVNGLQQPIFDDGSDFPEPDKTLNPDNLWANYVFAAVERYKPGGTLAQESDWTPEQGIRVWEVWNEPDLDTFWSGDIDDYARLLKVAYIVAKQADPESTVMFGGLLYATAENWLAQVLAIFERDPLREQFNWYMDQVAVHNYGYPWRSGWLTLYVRQSLSAYNLRRPIWLNESGVRVWDDYPGPLWAEDDPDLLSQRVTEEQQANFFIQSSVFAWSEGADVVFYHQLFDDCGDQPAGTDFEFHSGELCTGGDACFGDAYGLYRNENSAICFAQHPEPGTARPAAAAFELLADVFGAEIFENPRKQRLANDRVQVIAFERPATSERVYVIWNLEFEPLTFELPATSSSATLYSLTSRQIIQAENRAYQLRLEAAQPDHYPELQIGDQSAIGGPPLIVVEESQNLNIVPGFLLPPTPTPTPTATPDATESFIITLTAEAATPTPE